MLTLVISSRFNIFQLSYSFDEVRDYLQQHLTQVEQSNILDETDKTELYSMYINCLEVWNEFGRKEFKMDVLISKCTDLLYHHHTMHASLRW